MRILWFKTYFRPDWKISKKWTLKQVLPLGAKKKFGLRFLIMYWEFTIITKIKLNILWHTRSDWHTRVKVGHFDPETSWNVRNEMKCPHETKIKRFVSARIRKICTGKIGLVFYYQNPLKKCTFKWLFNIGFSTHKRPFLFKNRNWIIDL